MLNLPLNPKPQSPASVHVLSISWKGGRGVLTTQPSQRFRVWALWGPFWWGGGGVYRGVRV